jgi:hypothetical protein
MSARGHFSSAVAAAVSPASTKTVIYVAEGREQEVKLRCGKMQLDKSDDVGRSQDCHFLCMRTFSKLFYCAPMAINSSFSTSCPMCFED